MVRLLVRLLRILCVTSIAALMTFLVSLINNTLNIFEWLSFSKISISVLIFSLIYLLLDDKRSSLIGILALNFSIIGISLLILSINLSFLNNYWNISFGLIILSFMLVLYSKFKLHSITEKSIFYSSFLIPVGIIFAVENSLFYIISLAILILLSLTTIVFVFKGKSN